MFLPTVNLQTAIARHLHDTRCDFTYCTKDFRTCSWAKWNRQATRMIAAIMPSLVADIVPAVREDERTRVMDRMGLVPSSYDNCPGGHECGCAADALDAAYRAVEAPQADGVTLS